jgi:hypothetical protein
MYPVQRSVRVVLLNDKREVLLMCMDDSSGPSGVRIDRIGHAGSLSHDP